MTRQRSTTRTALSLLELMVTVVIVGVLAGLLIPRITVNSDDVKKNACYVTKGEIEVEVQRYFRNEGAWPQTSLSNMVPPGTYEYFPGGLPVCPVDGSSYTIDSATHEVVGHVH